MAIIELLKYEGSIPMICRWDQEILGYHFSIVHQSNKIITDGDAFTRRFGKLILQYCIITSILYSIDKQWCPKVYKELVFTKDNNVKITPDISQKSL